jgi:hypothetical protein
MNADTLAAIARAVGEAAGGAPSLAELRSRFPGVAFARVDAADVRGEEPAARAGAFALHLMDTRAHCLSLTQDPACATGVVLAA